MTGKIQPRFAVLVAFAALVTMLIPAGFAAASHDGGVAGGPPSYLRLRLGNQDNVTWHDSTGTLATQNITTKKNNCLGIVFGSSLLVATPIGGQLGEVKDSIGVKSASDGSGEPCGRIESDDGEQLSLKLGTSPALSGRLMTAVDVDLELKFNASVNVVFKHQGNPVYTYVGFTGGEASDDGPDSGDGDNYRFNHRPRDIHGNQLFFDEVVFVPTAGSISLEGGSDGTDPGTLDPDTNNWSQFEIVQTFDGEITCNDSVALGNAGIGVLGEVTMVALKLGSGPWDWDCSQLKNYNEDVTSSYLLFSPFREDSRARYTLELTVHDQPITTTGTGQMTSLTMRYSDGQVGSPDMPLLPCIGQPQFTEAFLEAADTGLFQTGHFACYYGVTVTPEYQSGGQSYGTEVWKIFFEDDPKFQFQ